YCSRHSLGSSYFDY
nr:immunoglobulin heavy chain junction region [Mus musculus]